VVKPVSPSNPTGGDGNEKYNPNPKRGPSKFDEVFEKVKSEPVKPSGGSSSGMPKSNRDLTKNYKSGGKVSSASKRADGCAIKGKTRGRIV
jgi:hypothetical protein